MYQMSKECSCSKATTLKVNLNEQAIAICLIGDIFNQSSPNNERTGEICRFHSLLLHKMGRGGTTYKNHRVENNTFCVKGYNVHI